MHSSVARLGLEAPSRRALRIACGPTPYHPRYPLLGFRVLSPPAPLSKGELEFRFGELRWRAEERTARGVTAVARRGAHSALGYCAVARSDADGCTCWGYPYRLPRGSACWGCPSLSPRGSACRGGLPGGAGRPRAQISEGAPHVIELRSQRKGLYFY